MEQVKVGDRIKRPLGRGDQAIRTVTWVSSSGRWFNHDGGVEHPDYHSCGGCNADFWEPAPPIPRMEDHKAEYRARANDPGTSKFAGKPNRPSLRERVHANLCHEHNATGTEIAEHLGARLNSVTPRLAELRRAGRIKDSGIRRDKQIVWVLA